MFWIPASVEVMEIRRCEITGYIAPPVSSDGAISPHCSAASPVAHSTTVPGPTLDRHGTASECCAGLTGRSSSLNWYVVFEWNICLIQQEQ